MLPSVLARQLERGIEDYIDTTFPMTNEPFKDSLKSVIHGADYLYHAPLFTVRLPFRSASSLPSCFHAVEMAYLPYVHQTEAFARLTGDHPRSTLIATGTGSGKTECFLYPILEHCSEAYREGRRGIKALVIYPMNALAQDQADRIMSMIHSNEKLKGHISVGMYIGGDVKVLAGITIGDNTIIGAGSVVTKDIPSGVIAAGNPCRVLRVIGAGERTERERQELEYRK